MKTIPELDGIRGIAILAVMGVHGTYGRVGGGFLGVDLFFVLSGFLITSLLIHEYQTTGTIHIGHFYARRALRILPPLLIGVLLAAALWAGPRLSEVVPAVLFFYANLLPDHDLGLLTHTWSLSIEEQFYLVWPMALLVLLRRPKLAVVACVGMVVLALAVRLWMLHAGSDRIDIYRFTLPRIDALAMGCLAAMAWRFTLPVVPLLCMIAVAFLVAQKENTWMLSIGYTVFAVLCATLTTSAARGSALLRNAAMRYIGRRSYGLYVYHFPIFAALEGLREHHSVTNYLWVSALRIAVTFAVAELSYRTVETYALSFKHHFRPHGASSASGGELKAH